MQCVEREMESMERISKYPSSCPKFLKQTDSLPWKSPQISLSSHSVPLLPVHYPVILDSAIFFSLKSRYSSIARTEDHGLKKQIGNTK